MTILGPDQYQKPPGESITKNAKEAKEYVQNHFMAKKGSGLSLSHKHIN